MKESILKSLLTLFANVIVYIEGREPTYERELVEEFLLKKFGSEISQYYLNYFDEQLSSIKQNNIQDTSYSDEVKMIFYSNEVGKICDQINKEFQYDEKIVLFMLLLDFMFIDKVFSSQEQEFISFISNKLLISREETHDATCFTSNNLNDIRNKRQLLIISSDVAHITDSKIKHLKNERVDGQIVVLRFRSSNSFFFRYYGDSNLFLNGHIIKPGRSYALTIGSIIKSEKSGTIYFSRIASRFTLDLAHAKFVFSAKDIDYRYPNSRNGIQNFSISEESGQLIGIIGGSGAGKSTLLNVLNGNLKPRNGRIFINQYDIHKDKEEIKGLIGYVPQDEFFIENLSVYKNLFFNAKLCFKDLSKDKIDELIKETLIDFDLADAKDLIVGNSMSSALSGGQRKRLNIALELMREPAILFIDEPTSGLSSMDSEKIMLLLKNQTHNGKLVIANIHQPSSESFKQFDKLIIIDHGGRIIYYGNPVDALTYFKKESRYVNAEENECFYCGNIDSGEILRLVEARVVDINGNLTRTRKVSPEEWYSRYKEKIESKFKPHDIPGHSLPKGLLKIPSRIKQFFIFCQRNVLSKLANTQYMIINTLEAPLLAFLLGFFTKHFNGTSDDPGKYIFSENDNIPAYLFMCVIVSLFMGLMVSAEDIFSDKKILRREKFLNLSRSSYLNSKVLILFIISAIQTISFIFIGNFILEIKGMNVNYWLILFATSCWANMVGLNLSSGLSSIVAIYITIPLILVPQMLFSGAVVEFRTMHKSISSYKHVPLIGDLNASRWSYEALVVNQYKNNKYMKNFFDEEMERNNAVYISSNVVPRLKIYLNKIKNDKELTKETKEKYISTIRNELHKLEFKNPNDHFKGVNKINPNDINNELIDSLFNFLYNIESKYVYLQQIATGQKDRIYNKMLKTYGGKTGIRLLKDKHHNKQLESIVFNDKELKEMYEADNELFPAQKFIYVYPTTNDGRTCFYAPEKRLFGIYIDTFYFNMIKLWLSVIMWYLILYFDLLRRLVNYIEAIRLSRSNRVILRRYFNDVNRKVKTYLPT